MKLNVNSIFNSIPFQFLLGGTLVALITYLANNVSPKAAAILVAFPIGLIPMFFIKSQNKERKMSFDTTITNVLVVITYIFLDFFLKQGGFIHRYAIVFAMSVWVIMAYLMYSFASEIGIKL